MGPVRQAESININFCEVSAKAVKNIWGYLTSPDSTCLKVVKVTLGLPVFLTLAAVSTGISALVALTYLAVSWAIIPSWSWSAIRNYADSALKETFGVFCAVLMFPVTLDRLNPKFQPGELAAETPIVLVNGYMHNSSAWFYHLEKLKEATVAPVYVVNITGLCKSIEDHTEYLEQQLKEIAKETGRSDVFLVGHSMGGFISTLYATKYASAGTVKGVVTLGAPLEGSVMTKLAIGPSAREMYPGSELVQEVDGLLKQTPIPFVHAGSDVDLLIRPPQSTIPEHPNASILEITNCGHTGFLYSEKINHKIVEAYRATCAQPSLPPIAPVPASM